MKIRAHVFVSGRVQGVFFRQTTQQKAQSFGVKGWIKNLLDGRVEAVFEGEENAIKELVDFFEKRAKRCLGNGFFRGLGNVC